METNKKEIMDTMMKRMKDKIKFKKYKMNVSAPDHPSDLRRKPNPSYERRRSI